MTAAIVIISSLVILAVAAQAFLLHKGSDAEANAIAGGGAEAMLGVVGTLFSVLLGLLVAGAIERYHDVQTTVEHEANSIGNIFRLAKGLEETDRRRVRGLCREYTDYVVEKEWKSMEQQEPDMQAQDRYNKLWEACVSIEPKNERQNNLHAAILDGMDNVGETRRERVIAAITSMPVTLWAVIICGSLITVAFTYLFTVRMGPRLHWMMTGLISVSLLLNIWLLYAYSMPFAGDLQIKPIGFMIVRRGTFVDNDNASQYLVPQNSVTGANHGK